MYRNAKICYLAYYSITNKIIKEKYKWVKNCH